MKKVPNCSIHNSITMLGRDKVLLGRCWGLSPQLKSVEFSFLPNVVHELQSILYVKPLKKVLHFMGSGPLRRTASDHSQPLLGMKWVVIPKNSSDLGHYFLTSWR